MAASDETIDPNDLDSIDALLDEAELEVTERNGDVASDSEKDAIDTLLDEAEAESVDLPELEPEEGDVKEGSESQSLFSEDSDESIVKEEAQNKPPAAKEVTSKERVTKSATAQSTPTTEMTAEDMESIKKLIIIFGSTLIVLAFIAIGIGVWSALAAQGAALDEETQTMIETIQVETARVSSSVIDSKESIQTMEKKLDALNFQLEELSSELFVSQVPGASAKKQEMIDPLGLNAHDTTVAPKTVKVPVVNSVVDQGQQHSNSEAMKLASSVNKKMISAQRRIDEVNRRVKDIQSKHKALLLSIKSLEKQWILQQKKMAVKEAEEKKKKQLHNPYQYRAPDESYYDQSVGDSYP